MKPKEKKAVLISSDDITDEKKLDEALDKALDELLGPDDESDDEEKTE